MQATKLECIKNIKCNYDNESQILRIHATSNIILQSKCIKHTV